MGNIEQRRYWRILFSIMAISFEKKFNNILDNNSKVVENDNFTSLINSLGNASN